MPQLGRRLIIAEPQAHRGELDHGEEVVGELVVAGGDASEVLELAKEALDLVALSVECLREAGPPLAVGLGRDVGDRALALDQVADGVAVVSLVAEHDGARCEAVEQRQRGGGVVRLPCRQAEPEREALPIDDRVDLGRETASGATETMISTPLFAVAACWCARMEVLSIIWMSPS